MEEYGMNPLLMQQYASTVVPMLNAKRNAMSAIKDVGSNALAQTQIAKDNLTITNIGEKLQDPNVIGLMATAAAVGGNALNLGQKGQGMNQRPGYTFNGMASGATMGAKIGSIVPGIGTAIGAGVGALAGTATDLIKFKKGNDQYKANNFVATQMKHQNQNDVRNYDYTGLSS